MKVTIGNVGRGLLQLYVCLAITHESGLVNYQLQGQCCHYCIPSFRVWIFDQCVVSNSSLAWSSEIQYWSHCTSTVLNSWVANVHAGLIIQVEESCIHCVTIVPEEVLICVCYANFRELSLWVDESDSMIDRVCNVVREARVCEIGIRVKQVDQVGPWRVVHKPGVHEAYHCVWVVLGKQGWRVLRPVLDKVAGDKLDGAPFLNQDVPTLVCLVSLEHTTWDSPRRLRKRDCRTFNGCCIVDELQILKSKYGPTFKPENTTRWELVICDEVRVHCFLVYCWEYD